MGGDTCFAAEQGVQEVATPGALFAAGVEGFLGVDVRDHVQREDFLAKLDQQRGDVAAAVGDDAHVQDFDPGELREAGDGPLARRGVHDRDQQGEPDRDARQVAREFFQQILVEHVGHHAHAQCQLGYRDGIGEGMRFRRAQRRNGVAAGAAQALQEAPRSERPDDLERAYQHPGQTAYSPAVCFPRAHRGPPQSPHAHA